MGKVSYGRTDKKVFASGICALSWLAFYLHFRPLRHYLKYAVWSMGFYRFSSQGLVEDCVVGVSEKIDYCRETNKMETQKQSLSQ